MSWFGCLRNTVTEVAKKSARAAGGRRGGAFAFGECAELEREAVAAWELLSAEVRGERTAAAYIEKHRAEILPELEGIAYQTYDSYNYD